MFRRRRPLMGAAMLGGTYMAGKSRARSQDAEADQEARLEQVEAQQAQQAAPPPPAPAPPPPPAPPAAAAPTLADQIKQLSALKDAGALTDEEFDAAKQKLLAG
jgi:Short C-terminal domain